MSVDVTITRPTGNSNEVALTVSSYPNGVTPEIDSPGSGDSGQVTFTAAPAAAAGTYTVGINASGGTAKGSAQLSLVVGIVAAVGNSVDTSLGVKGKLDMFMSTSFQPASWSDDFFTRNPDATGPLGSLLPQHIRLQALERDIPQKTATTWDFTYLDGVVNPVMSVGDHSPEFQIARGPDFFYNSSGDFVDTSYQTFANYAANLVRYYNTANGILDASQCTTASNEPLCKSYAAGRVDYWGIYNEPNINNLSAQQYVDLYNVTVPAMQSVDPTIKFVAVELADGWDEPEQYLADVVPQLTAQVDVLGTHFYSTCNQLDSDQQLFNAIDAFVPHITFAYSELHDSGLANVPVWLTENNVNADYNKGGGISACNGTTFVADQRGSSAYFAAWRPTLFSKFGKVGLRALYHWGFAADAQFGEVSQNNGVTYLSYWVDYWLARMFPSPPGSDILELNTTESTTVEILATRRADGTVVVMVANHAVRGATDNNGPGAARTVAIDLSALGGFSQASKLTLDATTDPVNGPSSTVITPASRIEVTLAGYGVTFLTLK